MTDAIKWDDAPATGGIKWDEEQPAAPSDNGAAAAPTSSFDYVNPSISKAVQNAPGSAWNFAKNTVSPFLHPIDTATNLGNVGKGVLEKTGVMSGNEHEKYADAVGQFFKDRYGSLEAARKTFEEDPVGMAGDLSAILTGGGSAAARLPGIAGRVGEVAGAAGRVLDPLNAVTPVANAAARGAGQLASHTLGLTTGVGEQPFNVAARAGYEGGASAQAFRDSVTGQTPMAQVVDEARGAIQQMRQERGDAYRRSMARVGADREVLDFSRVDRAIDRAEDVQTYSGQSGIMPTQSLNPRTEAIRSEMIDAVNHWRDLYPPEFHTAEGMDALKRQLGNIRDATEPNTPARVAANGIYNAVRQTIIDQVPEYARVMRGYEEASNLIGNIERELSLKPNANIDTGLRKLQSVLRNNVNTSFGRRGELANFLVNAGAPHLMERLAGQALNSWAPRGINRLAPIEIGASALGAIAAGTPGAGLAALAALPTMSPRLMGNATYGAGAAARLARPVARTLARTLRPARVYGEAAQENPYAP